MPDADAALLFETVRAAGDLALSMMRRRVKHWRKPDGSPVSEGDIAVDQLLKERLQKARPDYGWLSEETPDSAARLSCDTIWIADPIDGTRAFIAGKDTWGVAVALARKGRAVLGAVYCPLTDEFFTAIEGHGAFLNDARLELADDPALTGARIAGSKGALRQLSVYGIIPDISGSLPLQLRLAHVAAGRLDGALSTGHKNDWDLAAGDLLVREAGGMAGDLSGKPFVYNRPEPWQQGMIAAGAKRFAALTEALKTP
ncbi:3'(2'),5'-bisphosphate nucleotidase CysQ [Aestuariivirga sp.]|uniref:3'(2'),5'-bisphosphate nucleotidase CysQ n=1 Tax=Aestuariivirga sp. TaxID=2650926 RepID=UPI0039E37F8C